MKDLRKKSGGRSQTTLISHFSETTQKKKNLRNCTHTVLTKEENLSDAPKMTESFLKNKTQTEGNIKKKKEKSNNRN